MQLCIRNASNLIIQHFILIAPVFSLCSMLNRIYRHKLPFTHLLYYIQEICNNKQSYYVIIAQNTEKFCETDIIVFFLKLTLFLEHAHITLA